MPYGGTAPAINALMGGHVQAVWADYPTVVSQLKSGTLRGLVTTSPKRIEALPDVPTIERDRHHQVRGRNLLRRRGAGEDAAGTRSSRSRTCSSPRMKAPDMKPKLAQQGMFPVGTCGDRSAPSCASIVADYERIIKQAGIKTN